MFLTIAFHSSNDDRQTLYCKSINFSLISTISYNIQKSCNPHNYKVGCAGVAKGLKYFRDLKRANCLYTLEKCSESKANSSIILAEASKRLALREEILKNGNLKIHWDRQNKHVKGTHNYIPDRSIFEHIDAQRLINEYAGTGKRVNNAVPGTSNYREIIDFNEHIGIWKNSDNTLALPTTRGTIHYSKAGVHIIPAEPKPKYTK